MFQAESAAHFQLSAEIRLFASWEISTAHDALVTPIKQEQLFGYGITIFHSISHSIHGFLGFASEKKKKGPVLKGGQELKMSEVRSESWLSNSAFLAINSVTVEWGW